LYCSGSGFCRPLCLTDGDCGAGRCESFDEPRRAGETTVGNCSEVCNPVAPSVGDDTFAACPPGFRCSGDPDPDGLSTCTVAGTGGYGTACDDGTDCAPGFFCGTDSDRCRKYCFDASDCESGVCNIIDPPSLAADRQLGFCTDP
jgi:hypothetical protein